MKNKKIKILAIDDNRDNLITLKAIISEELPQSVVYVELSGKDGIESARKNDPDVILLDIVMPVMDGYEVCKILKADEQLSETPIIFLTALKGDKQSRILALEAGGEAFLAKPIDAIELKAQIHAMLKIKKAANYKREQRLQLEELVQKRTEELKRANTATLNLMEDLKTENEIRKQHEEDLIASNLLNKTLLSTIPFGMDIVNEKGNILFLSENLAKLFGIDVLGKKCWELYCDDKTQCCDCPLHEEIVQGRTSIYEKSGIMEGKTFEIYHSGIDFKGQKALLEIFIDITERKQAEENQKNSKKLLAETESIGKVGGWSFNIDTKEQKWTDEVYRIHEVELLSGPSVDEGINYYTKESSPIIAKAVQRGIEHGENFDLELEIITAKGNTRSVHTIGKADLKNRRIYGFFQDITERKLAEAINKKLLNQFELISFHLPGVIYQFKLRPDGSSHFPYASPGIYNIYGVHPKDVEHDATNAFKAIHPDDKEQVSVSIKHSAQTLTTWHDIYRTNQPSGKTIWVEGNSTPQKMEDGSIIWHGFIQDITERKIAEEAVRESDAKLKKILANLQDAYMQADLMGNITYVNPTALTMFGYDSIEELLGLPASNLYADKKDREFLLKRLRNSKKVTDYVLNGFRKDNSTFWASISVQFTLDNEGRINGTEGVVRDISERKQTEEQLLKLSQAVEQSPVSIILTDTKGNVEYANPKALKISGYALEEIKGKNPRIFSSGEKPKSEYENLWATILSGKEWRGEFHNRRKSGELYWELASISPIINDRGEIINFLAVKEDITERKQILDDLIVAKENAEESEIRLLEAQKITKVGSWETDLSNFKVIWSDETYRIFEISSTIFQGTHQAFLNFVHPDDKKIVDDAFAKSFETRAYNSIEHRIITAKDTIKYVEERWKIVLNDQEKPTRAIGSCQDITERKLAEQELKKAKVKAEESDRLKSAFLANMSHEIRTPMNGILGFSGLLKEPGLTDEKQQKYIRIIEKSGARMLNIINNIVDISKIESGLMEVNITETDINENIENLYQFFESETEAKNIHFSVEKTLPKNEAIIKTDSEKLYGVLSNLLKNAIKFTNEGKIVFGVGVTNSSKGQKQLKFFIKDTGIGIPKNRQEAIFERFIQADIYDKMAVQGAGLGLSISKAYVEMLGGKIWVESEEGIGSAFYFTIPCSRETEEIIKQNAVIATKINKKVGNLKILISEDDEASQMLLSTIAEAYASEIFIANDGIEAVEIYKNNPDIDLILMDIQMPNLNGYEATKQIRQLNKKVVIIAQTAYALSFDRQKVIDAGCNDYISKPILTNDLKTLIGNYFEK